MPTSITFDSSTTSEVKDFTNRFKLTPEKLDAMKGKSLGLIAYEGMLLSIRIHQQGNQLFLELRRQSMEEMSVLIDKKVKSYDRITLNIVIPILEGLGSLMGVAGGPLQFIGQAFTATLRGASGQLQDGHQTVILALDHISKQADELFRQYNQGSQESKQQFGSLLDLCRQQAQQETDAISKSAAASSSAG